MTPTLDRLQKEYEEEMAEEGFSPPKVSVLEVMKNDRQAHLAQDLFDKYTSEGNHRLAEKVGKFMLYKFGINNLAN